MIDRRNLTLALPALVFATAARAQAPAADPVAIMTTVYTRAARGKGEDGGSFIIEKKAQPKYLSKSLIALWAKADAHTPKGDVGPVDFDPVTNSQDPDVKSFKVVAEKQEADRAVIAVSFIGHRNERRVASDQTVRYDFVREKDWKIDDIRGSIDGKPWSIREMLKQSLKN